MDDPGPSILFFLIMLYWGRYLSQNEPEALHIQATIIENVYDKLPFFSPNFAYYGGEIYDNVADETRISGICDNVSYVVHSTLTECSMQTLVLHTVNLIDNKAHILGSNLFGGLLD